MLVNIRLEKLKGRPREIKFCEPATEFPALHELVERERVEFTAPVEGSLVATWAGDVIEVTGRISSGVIIPCSRCLDDVRNVLVVDVHLCYSRSPQGEEGGDEEEVELNEDDLGLIPVTGEEIDLRPEIEQEIIMALPQHLLCKESCAGLCPVCGTNLNRSTCQCERPVFHAGLAVLKDFKVDK